MNNYIYIYIRTLDYSQEEKKTLPMLATLPNNPMFDRKDHIYRRIPTVRLEQHFYYPIQQQQNVNTENRTIKSPR